MDYKKVFERFEKDSLGKQPGFTRITTQTPLDSAQKAALNRKGNVLFNSGDIESARKIFLATGYSDGLSRVGDAYQKQGKLMEALRMYQIAPNPRKFEEMVTQLSAIIQNLLKETDATGPHPKEAPRE
ncbi:MAG: hypothetical protein LBS86_04375 [Treponema sp.]|jgi:hypothetical protein|nr:hypothetical protein [Treponema sp.]